MAPLLCLKQGKRLPAFIPLSKLCKEQQVNIPDQSFIC